MAKITYYDHSNFHYVSFFLNGFIANAKERGYKFAVSHKLPPELINPSLDTSWPYTPGEEKVSIFRYEDVNRNFLFCLDGSDINGEYPVDGYSGYSELLLQYCDYYFKVNYNEKVIANNPFFAAYADKIRPVPHVWALGTPQRWRFLPRQAPIRYRSWSARGIKRRINLLRRMRYLEDFRRLRTVRKTIDVFFVTTYRPPEEKHGKQHRDRLAIIEELVKRRDLNLVVGFTRPNLEEVPRPYAKYKQPHMSYDQYLNMLARSRIGLYTRGSFGCLSFKFGEQLALGKPIVGETLLNNTKNMYSYERFDEQFAFDDPYELTERIVFLLSKPDYISELEKTNTETFERYLTPKPVIADLLDKLEIG